MCLFICLLWCWCLFVCIYNLKSCLSDTLLICRYQTGALAPVIQWLSQGMRRAAAPPARPAARPDNLPAAGEPGNENAPLLGKLSKCLFELHIKHLFVCLWYIIRVGTTANTPNIKNEVLKCTSAYIHVFLLDSQTMLLVSTKISNSPSLQNK